MLNNNEFIPAGAQTFISYTFTNLYNDFPNYFFGIAFSNRENDQAPITISQIKENLLIYYDNLSGNVDKLLRNNYVYPIDWENTLIQSSVSPSTTRISTITYIPKNINSIVAGKGYLFRVAAYDENEVYQGTFRETGEFKIAGNSKNLKYFDLTKYNYSFYKIIALKEDNSVINPEDGKNINLLPFVLDGFNDDDNTDENPNNNLCLCALKTDILNNKLPFTRGYLFHKLQNDNKSLYYGEDFHNIKKIGTLPIYPSDYLLAVSPTDGRVILTRRGERGNMYIYHNNETIKLFNDASIKPMGWLYNSGVEFIRNAEDIEQCIFAEYSGDPSDKGGYYVWRGTYPYTSENDWERIFHMDFDYYSEPLHPNTITHFHQVKRDPFTNIIYLTSGDKPSQLYWWYSTDFGNNWNLLINDRSASYNWEEHILRTINFIFTKDYIYWATDFGTNHCLNRIQRDTSTGIIDISTREKLCDLTSAHATNSLCYVENPKGLFLYDRVDSVFPAHFGESVDLYFYDLINNTLQKVYDINLTAKTWGGNRGKCYINYTNIYQPYPAIGFSIDSPCIFDLISDNNQNIGSLVYDIGGRTLKTITI